MSFIQKADAGALATAANSLSTATFPGNVTAGNFLWANAAWGDSGTNPTSVTINGQTATAVGTAARDNTNNQSAQLFFVLNATGGSTTGGTVNFAVSTNFVGLIVNEESGVATSSATDGTNNVFVSPVAVTGTTGTFTTTQANDLIIAGFVDSSGTTTAVNTPTATNSTLGIRDTTSGTNVEMSTASGAQTSAGVSSLTWTWTTNANALIIAAGFKTAAAAVASVAAPLMPSKIWAQTGGKLGFAKLLRAVAAVLNNITGTAGFQNGTDKLAATATETFSSTAALKNGTDKLAATATETFSGTTALKNGTDKLAATGAEVFGATAALKNGTDKLAATAQERFSGTTALKNGPDTLSSTATETISGTAALTGGPDRLSATDGSSPGITGNVPTINAPLVMGTLMNRS